MLAHPQADKSRLFDSDRRCCVDLISCLREHRPDGIGEEGKEEATLAWETISVIFAGESRLPLSNKICAIPLIGYLARFPGDRRRRW